MPATVPPAPGWLVDRVSPSFVVATTEAPVVRPFALFGSFRRLSRDGIVVWVVTIGRNRPNFPARSQWPPRLPSFRVERGWECQPETRIQQRVWVAAVHGWDLDVRVYFGTQRPPPRLRALAQAELDRLRLPR